MRRQLVDIVVVMVNSSLFSSLPFFPQLCGFLNGTFIAKELSKLLSCLIVILYLPFPLVLTVHSL